MYTKEKMNIPYNKVKGVVMVNGVATDSALLEGLGVNVFDAAPATITTASSGTPVQKLQMWDPEMIRIATAPTKADDIMGRRIIGDWEDEEIITKVIEPIGQAVGYGDSSNVTLANFNTNFEHRDIVRFELGYEVTRLEEKRAAKMQVSADAEKRFAVTNGLKITMNNVAFNGYNTGNNATYGMLNDPNLSNYITVATGAGGDTEWSSKTFSEITADLRAAFAQLSLQTKGLFEPQNMATTLCLPPSQYEYLTVTTEIGGYTIKSWLENNYPKCRIELAPQFAGANSNSDVFYLFADRLNEQEVLNQNVQAVLMYLGFEPKAKGKVEDFSNATAGFMLRQPLGLVRYAGI